MKRKILCLLLALMMAFACTALLASCIKPEQTSSTETKKETKPTVDPSEDEEEEEEIVEVTNPLWEGKTKQFTMSICDQTDDSVLTGGRGYVAGNNEWTADSAVVTNDILKLVAQRNTNASIYANVNVVYSYDKWGWGQATKQIHSNVLSGVSGLPDVYYHDVYDMVASSVRGDFKNVLNNQYLNVNEDGYNKDYMDVLSFSTQKQYLIASDFAIDIARCFYIVPVSIDILQKRQALGENQSTTQDFFDLIDNNQWTWDVVATMCDRVKEVGKDGEYVFNDGVVGMAADTYGGFPAASMLYSSTEKIITRTIGNDGEYVYTYDPDGKALLEVATKLKQTIGSTDGFVTNYSAGLYDTSAEAIAYAFNEGHMLIGGVTILGAIESEVYRTMWDTANEKNGFIVAPLPLYESGTAEDGWMYRTLVVNTAKVFGIGKSSLNTDRCAAYLDYGSRKSSKILEEFFQWTILYDAAGADEKNVEYLVKMRADLGYTLDKTVDDALAYFGATYSDGDSFSGNNRFQLLLLRGSGSSDEFPFKVGANIVPLYKAIYASKERGVRLMQGDFVGNNTEK